MKAERRHELHENELAQALEKAKAYLDAHGKRLALIVGGALVLVIVVSTIMRSASESRSRDWARYSDLVSGASKTELPQVVTDLQALADATHDPALALSALGRSGELALTLTLDAANNDDARKYTDQAELAFKQLQARFSQYPLARGVALCGLATVAENRFALTGDASLKDVARGHLERVSSDAELNATPMQSQAISRLALLDEIFKPAHFDPAPVAAEGTQPARNEVMITPGSRNPVSPSTPPTSTPPAPTP